MSDKPSKEYFLKDQYKDASKLGARYHLQKSFSMNKQNWHRWVFEQFGFPVKCNILELGCGPGYLWFENKERIPKGWKITLSDFSKGILDKARTSLSDIGREFTFRLIDAETIPYPPETFDAVIANHMLYHLPDVHARLLVAKCRRSEETKERYEDC